MRTLCGPVGSSASNGEGIVAADALLPIFAINRPMAHWVRPLLVPSRSIRGVVAVASIVPPPGLDAAAL